MPPDYRYDQFQSTDGQRLKNLFPGWRVSSGILDEAGDQLDQVTTIVLEPQTGNCFVVMDGDYGLGKTYFPDPCSDYGQRLIRGERGEGPGVYLTVVGYGKSPFRTAVRACAPQDKDQGKIPFSCVEFWSGTEGDFVKRSAGDSVSFEGGVIIAPNFDQATVYVAPLKKVLNGYDVWRKMSEALKAK
jgi:hypothetical protein